MAFYLSATLSETLFFLRQLAGQLTEETDEYQLMAIVLVFLQLTLVFVIIDHFSSGTLMNSPG